MMARSLAALVLLFAATPAFAAKHPAHTPKPAATEKPAAEEAPDTAEHKPRYHPTDGPKTIDLGHDLTLELPTGMLFLAKDEGKIFLERQGNIVNDPPLGIVSQYDKSWFVVLRYVEEGYVKDDDAADFKADEILSNMRQGNEEDNEIRRQRGEKPLTLDGWTEPPRYERGPHHLVWGLKLHDDDGTSINFYTRVLGRRGYVAINLVDAADRIQSSRDQGLAVLKATTFRKGARYEDFDKKNDKVAEYGLAALVAGGAGAAALKLAKVGLLAKFGGKIIALLIALKKGIVVFFLAIGAAVKRFFARLTGKKETVAAGPPGPPRPAPSDLRPPDDFRPNEPPPAG